jgi:hypothetical protein
MTITEFARSLIQSIRKAGDTLPLEFDPDKGMLFYAKDPAETMNLENAFAEYRSASPAQRPDILGWWTRVWVHHRPNRVTLPQDFALARSNLLLQLYPREFVERADTDDDRKLAHKVVSPNIVLGIVYDLPELIADVSRRQLAQWRVTFEEAFAIARDNLTARSRGGLVRVAPGVWRSSWNDSYEAARLALPIVFKHLPLKGDPVVMVPHREALFVTGFRR